MSKVVFLGTTNKGKIREFSQVLKTIEVKVKTPDDLGIDFDPDETGQTYEEIAMAKAHAWAEKSGLPTLVDDSGLSVDALNGAPGIFSKRFFDGSDGDRNQFLLSKLSSISGFKRTAYFYCALAFVDPVGVEQLTVGKCYGRIAEKLSGDSGFGYDPLFIPDGYTQSFAQLGDNIKTQLSHRAIAVEKMLPFLKEWSK
jgi:XTP/dITP diphosphohydrolase